MWYQTDTGKISYYPVAEAGGHEKLWSDVISSLHTWLPLLRTWTIFPSDKIGGWLWNPCNSLQMFMSIASWHNFILTHLTTPDLLFTSEFLYLWWGDSWWLDNLIISFDDSRLGSYADIVFPCEHCEVRRSHWPDVPLIFLCMSALWSPARLTTETE